MHAILLVNYQVQRQHAHQNTKPTSDFDLQLRTKHTKNIAQNDNLVHLVYVGVAIYMNTYINGYRLLLYVPTCYGC